MDNPPLITAGPGTVESTEACTPLCGKSMPCQRQNSDVQAPPAQSTREVLMRPRSVTTAPMQITLNPHGEGLSSAQRAAVYDMIIRWRTAQAGPIVVETASGGGAAADQATQRLGAFMAEYGLRPPEVSFRRYEGAAGAPIKVSFPVYRADIPHCGDSWGNLARPDNQAMPNFGCANAANIAAMVANPGDLASPPSDPNGPDASRRQVTLEKYRAGADTEIMTKGRHDPCVGIRAVPVGEAMMACVLADHFLRDRGQVGR